MLRFMKVVLLMFIMIALTTSVMACQYCQKEDPGISIFSGVDLDEILESAAINTDYILQKSSTLDLSANVSADLTLHDDSFAATMPSSLEVLQPGYYSLVEQSGKGNILGSTETPGLTYGRLYSMAFGPNDQDGTDYNRHEDPGRTEWPPV